MAEWPVSVLYDSMTSDLHSEMLNLELGEASMELQGVPVRGVTA